MSRNLILCIAFILSFMSFGVAQSNRLALVVAINDYDLSNGWGPLNTDRDVSEISAALEKQGFAKDQVLVIRNKEATKARILQSIRTHLLEKARKGGIVYFHFSGHGQQKADYSGDEFDGYDEALVPVDAKSKYDPEGYKGELHLTDDELMQSLNEVRKKLGPTGQMLLVIDACFSGSMLRSARVNVANGVVVRGTEDKMAPSDWGTSKNVRKETSLETYDNDTELSPIVSITASQSHQQNYEYMGGGSLSHAVSTQLAAITEQMTYRGLFERVKLQMASMVQTQTPQADGHLDRYVFGGQATVVHPFFRVVGSNDEGNWILDGGALHGLTEGSIVGFFETETQDFSAPRAKVTVLESRGINSVVPSVEGLDQTQVWAYLIKQAPSDLTVGVKVQLQDKAFEELFLAALQKQGALTNQPPYQCFVSQRTAGDSVYLTTSDGQLLKAVWPTDYNPGVLITQLNRYSRAKYLRSAGQDIANASRSNKGLEISLIPVQVVNRVAIKELPIDSFMDALGNIELPIGTAVRLRVKNTGNVSGYFNLLDIQPDNQINVLFPSDKSSTHSANDYFLTGKDDEVFEYPPNEGEYLRIGPPDGEEFLKVVVAKSKFDFRTIIKQKEEVYDETFSFPQLLEGGLSGVRGLSESFTIQDLTYYQKTFRIVKAKK
jgi:hypothetical protein